MRLLETAALAALGALTAFDAIWDAGAQTIEKKALSAAAAHQMISIAAAEARKRGAFAVVDEGGDLIAFERIDGTFAASATISIGKARTAAVFQRPPAFFEDVINKGRTAKTTLTDVLPEFTPLSGGVPVTIDGKMVGAIGVSGAKSARHDHELAEMTVKAIVEMKRSEAAEARHDVAHFDRKVVEEVREGRADP